MPKGTYQPGKKVRIEPDENNKTIRFYDLKDNALIEEHQICTGIGKCIRNNHPERDKFAKLQSIKDKVLSGFESERGKEFVKKIIELKPRYVRDQLGILLKLQEQYSKDELLQGIDYCVERNIFSANDFKDTLEYFRQKEPAPVITKVLIPFRYSVVVAQTRPIEVYANLCNGGYDR